MKKGGDDAIKRWINNQLDGRSCTIVLIGSQTAERKWIKYEIEKSWNDGKGLLGIYIHNLKDAGGKQTTKGKNPFVDFNVKVYDPPYSDSKDAYNYISNNIETWIEDAVAIRGKY